MIKKIILIVTCIITSVCTTYGQNVFKWQLAGIDTTIHQIVDFIELPDSNIIVTGTAYHTPGDTINSDPFLMRMDKKGNMVWAKTYPGSVAETITGIAIRNGSQIVVSGTTHSFNNRIIFNEFNDYLGAVLYYFDLNGNLISAEAFQEDKTNTTSSNILSNGGFTYLAGTIQSTPNTSFVRKTNPTTGVNTKLSANGNLSLVKAILVENNWVGVFKSDAFYSANQSVVIALSGSSSINWAKAINLNTSSVPTDIFALSDGYLISANNNLNGKQTVLLTKLDLDGELVWSKNYSANAKQLFANNVLQINASEIQLNGSIQDGLLNKAQTLVVNENGDFLNLRTYPIDSVSIIHAAKSNDRGIFYVLNHDNERNKNGWLLKNNQNNLYQCQTDESNLITATDVSLSIEILNAKSNLTASSFSLESYQYEFNDPTNNFTKDVFNHETCFKCDVNAGFTYQVDEDCYLVTFIPNDTTLKEYHWDFNQIGGYSEEQYPTYEYDEVGTYNVTLMAFNVCGMASTTQEVTVEYKGLALFDISNTCYDIVATPRKPADQYIWLSEGKYSIDNILNFTFINPGSHWVNLTANNHCVTETNFSEVIIEDRAILAEFQYDNNCETYTFSIINDSHINNITWTFGDGTNDGSNAPVIMHDFSEGNYDVSVVVSNECFSDTFITNISVDDYTVDPSFSYELDCNNVSFSHDISNVTDIAWDFGDGNNDTLTNPQHDYGDAGGLFNVTLTVTDACGRDFTSNQDINLPDYDIDPNFTDSLICNEYTFEAVEPIGNLTDVYWDFDDGQEAIGHQVTHSYAADGNYDVRMTAFNTCNLITTSKTINHIVPFNQVGFNYNNNCNTVTFTNTTSVGAISYAWDYGNGTSSTLLEEAVVYTPGTYDVSLTVDFGCETLVHTETITIANQVPDPAFDAYIFCKDTEFKLLNTSNVASIAWDLGDGSSRTGTFGFSHHYVNVGTYNTQVTITGVCGDIVTSSEALIIDSLVQAFAGDDVTICEGRNTKLQASGGRNIVWTPSGTLTNPNIANPTASPLVTTIYEVTITDDVCKGMGTDQVTVTVVPSPTASISGKQTICEGDFALLPINFTGLAPYTLTYNINGGTPQTFGPTNNVNDFLPIGEAGIVNITNVSNNICNAPTFGSGEVNVNNLPIADMGNYTIDACNLATDGATIPINITENGDWELVISKNGVDLPMILVNSSPYSFETFTPGVYTIRSVKNANCEGEGMGEVTVIDHPNPAAIISAPSNICTGSTYDLTITLTGTAPFTFDLFQDGVLLNNYVNLFNYSLVYSIFEGGDYEVRNLTDKYCVASSDFGPFTVTENAIPYARMIGGGSLCNGAPTNITIKLDSANNYTFVYAIDGVNQPAISTTGDYTISTSTLGVYTLVSVENNGCFGYVSGSTEVFPEPTAILSGDQDICTDEIKYLDFVFTGKPPFKVLLFRNGGPFEQERTAFFNNFKYPVTEGGVYTIGTFKDASCSGTKTGVATLTAYQTAQGVIYGGGQICENSVDTINIYLTGTKPYTFIYSENNTQLYLVESYYDDTYSFITNKKGIYRLPFLRNDHCFNTPFNNQATGISHFPVPTARLIAADTICDGEPHEFEVKLTGRGYQSLTYTFGTDTIMEDSILSSTFMIPSTVRGDYKLISTQDTLCNSEEVFNLGRLKVHDLPTLQLSGDTFKCRYETRPLNFDFTGKAPFSADLDTLGNFFRTVEPIYTHHYAMAIKTPSKYSVQNFSDANCSNVGIEEVLITNYNTPVVRFEGGGIICDPDSIVTLYNTTIKVDDSKLFTWDFDDGETSNMVDTTARQYEVDRCYDITLTHETEDGCVFDTTMFDAVCVDHMPEAAFIYEPKEPTIFSDYINLINESTNGAEFVWEFNDGIDGTNDDFNTTYTNFNRLEGNLTNVCLQATSYLGCQHTYCEEIFIKDEFVHYVPSSFTPNGDGINDFFAPVTHHADNYLFELQIFSRAGELLYQSNTVKIPIWDGRFKGNLVKQDVYTWKLKIKSESTKQTEVEHGMVTIIY